MKNEDNAEGAYCPNVVNDDENVHDYPTSPELLTSQPKLLLRRQLLGGRRAPSPRPQKRAGRSRDVIETAGVDGDVTDDSARRRRQEYNNDPTPVSLLLTSMPH